MSVDSKQRIYDLIKKSESPLVLIPDKSESAAVASALALLLTLRKMDKNPQAVCPGVLPEKYSYMPGIGSIAGDISGERLHKISINIGEDNVNELTYEKTDKTLTIFLTSKTNVIDRNSINVESSKSMYDLIIVVSVLNTEPLGYLYQKNKDLFSHTSIISIGSPFPKQFGGTDVTEVSPRFISERIAGLTQQLVGDGWDKDIATLLLAGVINETNNFQSSKIDHSLFSLAASLMSSGADREEIVKHL